MVKHKPSLFFPNACELPLEPHSRYLCDWSISTHGITREDREQRKGPEKAETAGRTAFVKENKGSACRPLHHGICHPLELEWGGNCHWVLKEFTDLEIEENTEEGQDAEGGSSALNSLLCCNSCCYQSKNISIPLIPTLTLNVILWPGQGK